MLKIKKTMIDPSNDSNLIPLSREEALEAMKAGERLVNGEDDYGIAHYHWHEGCVLKSDSYYDLYGEGNIIPENKLPQLYRLGLEGAFRSITEKEDYWSKQAARGKGCL